SVHDGHEFKRDKFIEEGGDVLFYLTWLCDLYDVTLEEIVTPNMMKRRKRYPNGYSIKDSVERKDVNNEYPTPEQFEEIVNRGYTSSFQDEMNSMYKVDVKG